MVIINYGLIVYVIIDPRIYLIYKAKSITTG